MPISVQELITQAKSYSQSGYPREAIECWLEVERYLPNDWEVLFYLGEMYRTIGDLSTAEQYYYRSRDLAEDKTLPICRLALIAERRSNLDRAKDLLEGLVTVDFPNVDALALWGLLGWRMRKSADVVPILQKSLGEERSNEELSLIHSVLAKNLDAMKDYPNAFHHFTLSNTLRQMVYVPQHRHTQVNELIQIPHIEPLHHRQLSSTPVLIIGFMRSGSTVLEQALGSHSQVSICGEHNALEAISQQIPVQLGFTDEWPKASAQFSEQQSFDVAQFYLSEMEKVGSRPKSPFIVDKTLSNYQLLEFAYRLFPNLKIVHCERNALDTCLSCFVTNFDQGHAFSTRLEWLGEEYQAYQKVISHFQKTMNIHSIQYEKLVSDPEFELRRLLEYLDLEWEESCLHPNQNSRVANTASYAQVTQAFHQGSIGKSQNYYDELLPLRKILQIQ